MSFINLIVFLSLITLTGFSDYLLKRSSENQNLYHNPYFYAALLTYFILCFFWAYLYKSFELSWLNVIYSVSLILITSIIGLFIFNEKITSTEALGMFFGLLSLYFLNK